MSTAWVKTVYPAGKHVQQLCKFRKNLGMFPKPP